MSYNHNNPDELSELLSAYLDGELTADEQAIVEQRLAESAEFRQLHDELRALRSGLESLPRYKLNDDLASIVLRRAERTMLSTPAVSQLAPATSSEPVVLADRPTTTDRVLRGLKMFRWSIVAVAVAMLIMIFNPGDRQDEQQVALHKTQEDAAPYADMIAAPTAGETASQIAPANDRRLREYQDDRFAADELAKPEAASTPAANLAVPAEASRMGELRRSGAGDGIGVESFELGNGKGGGFGGAPSAARKSAKLSGKKMKSPELQDQKSADRDAELPDDVADTLPMKAEGGPPDTALGMRKDAVPVDARGVLIVQCDISPEAARSGAFEKLLAEQKIALYEGDVSELRKPQVRDRNFVGQSGGLRSEGAVPKSQSADVPLDEAVNGQKSAGPGVAGKDRSKESVAEKNENKPAHQSIELFEGGDVAAVPLDGFLVEASPAKVEATLAALMSRQKQFPTVVFTQSPVVEGSGDAAPEERPAQAVDAPSAPLAKRPADLIEQTAPNEPLVDRDGTEREAREAEHKKQSPERAKLELHFKSAVAAPEGDSAENFRSPARTGLAARGSVVLSESGGFARRVSVDPAQLDQWSGPAVGDKHAERLDRQQFRRDGGTAGRVAPQAQAAPVGAAPAIADEAATANEPAAPAASLIDPQAAAKPAAGNELTAKVAKSDANASEGESDKQSPPLRVLFLFRVVPAAGTAR